MFFFLMFLVLLLLLPIRSFFLLYFVCSLFVFSPLPPSPLLDALTDNTALSLSSSLFTTSDLCWGLVRRLLSLN